MTLAKICGLTDPDMLSVAVAAGADLIGLVFFPPSPRNLTPERAAGLTARLPDHPGRVGVFVDPDDDLLDAADIGGRLTAIQLHGHETPERVAAVRARFGKPVWKAVPVRGQADIAAARVYRGVASLLLFDAKAADSPLPGGNGVRFDWRLLDGVDIGMPWGLSGGLDPGNVADAIGATSAPLVDVSSGVEDAPGVKSADRIRAFMKAVRAR